MAPTLFRILLALVAFYALTRGGRDERQVGIILILGVMATNLVISPVHERYSSVETSVMLVDVGVLAGFVWVALQSERFWPLWIAGFQLTTMIGHFLKVAEAGLFPRAYGAAMIFWVYPMLLILAVGTWRTGRRHARIGGPAPA
ncbi:MAG TPA: hypothetical protein VD768_01975 [Sphingomicrobium sp.]|nr:hypothetical protein [Sphingomicrobium sp.]